MWNNQQLSMILLFVAVVVISVEGFTNPGNLLQSRVQVPPIRAVAVQQANGEDIAVNGDAAATMGDSDEEYLWSIRLNVFEKARTVANVCTSGTLCTVSGQEGMAGAPFGSFVDYVLDDDGNPVLLMNDMSMHTMNICEHALNKDGKEGGVSSMVTLFAQLTPDASKQANQGQDVSRCSLTCRVEKIDENTAEDMDVIRMRYSLTHAYADQVMDSPKFSFYRLIPEKIYYVGGFGVMAKWVDVEDYKAATPDILSIEAGDIVTKLNREFRTDLEMTAEQLLGVPKEILTSIRVTNVDRLGMDLRVTRQQGTRRNKLSTDEYRVGFRIPVVSVEDAKSEVLKVFQEAWEKGNDILWGEDVPPGSTVPIVKIAADSLE